LFNGKVIRYNLKFHLFTLSRVLLDEVKDEIEHLIRPYVFHEYFYKTENLRINGKEFEMKLVARSAKADKPIRVLYGVKRHIQGYLKDEYPVPFDKFKSMWVSGALLSVDMISRYDKRQFHLRHKKELIDF